MSGESIYDIVQIGEESNAFFSGGSFKLREFMI